MIYIPKFPMERDKVVSDKEKVLAKWPSAYSLRINPTTVGIFYLDGTGDAMLGEGSTEPEAWADTARRLEDGK